MNAASEGSDVSDDYNVIRNIQTNLGGYYTIITYEIGLKVISIVSSTLDPSSC
ncbi:protein of unknown function [Xenorhabdus nematophila AN6/1]|nr:hypothetical protein XNA1_1720008 [Xenorhabdus nematophila str. Anatoliense]CEE94947.1 hypothetical protein XNA1_4860009 [Xenorhabdus nematophila str. Anatoliense]CEF28971.1 hypothetical protein XNW1_1470007 [Xenorhabdus nematophila str. Websteri]CEF33707.1 hypothetical protein XNW1_4900007 [Xenorhabdus nematophila str. Websteri]CEK24981.1 protein of unknown function [Xenorhabdus nematophila AN6/1]